MVKHNNQIPNIHCKKKYLQSSRGPLKVKLFLNQATRKKARRVKRQASKSQPKLRPVVHCPTQKYSAKVRLGKGFTLEELKAAQLHPSKAIKMGIAIDWRRQNHSQESLDRNVARLQEYKQNFVVLPKDQEVPKIKGPIMPVTKAGPEFELMSITQEMKDFKAFTTVRVARQETKVAGYRVAVENRKKND